MIMYFASTLDKAFAAFIFCTFLVCNLVYASNCPSAGDLRTNDCRTTYKSLADGNITRYLDIFAGQIEPAFCIAHCGCLSKAYAGLDLHGHCFCGAEQGATCSTGECLRVYSTTGIPASPSATFPTKLKLFEESSVTISGLSNVVQFGVENEGKLSYFKPSTGKIAFVENGERKAAAEVEGYWGCRTVDSTVKVYSPLNLDLICPIAVRPNEVFYCWVKFHEGSEIQSLQWKLDGAPNGAAITSVGEPLVIKTGGNLTVDRFEKFNASFDYLTAESVTFINLNYEFPAIGRVKAFEGHFIRLGEIRFQIFRPMCDPVHTEKTLCHRDRKCVSSGCGTPSNKLGDREFYPEASKNVFCPDVERFKLNDNNTCPGPAVRNTPGCDYELVHQYSANVTHLGNQIIPVPESKNLTVYPGYVLAWSTGPNNRSADIGSYYYDSAYDKMEPEYKYNEAYETFPGSIFSRKLPTASIFRKFHLIQAHTVAPTHYLKKMTLSNLGQPYTVGVTVTAAESSVSKTVEVAVQTDITSFTLIVSNPDIYKNTDNTLSIKNINTEVGVAYSFHFGETAFNGTFDTTIATKTIMKQWAEPGIYVVICRAANKLGYVDQNVTVNVYAHIDELQFTKEVDPEPTGDISTSVFAVNSTGNATITYNLGDNTTDRVLNVTLTAHFVGEIQYKYGKEGDYMITALTANPLESKSIGQFASVEDAIAAVVIDPPGVAATNVTHNFTIAEHVGTNVTYVWDWKDDTDKSNSTVNNRNMSHTYTTYGNRTISVFSYNKISNFTSVKDVEVQDIIKGLNFSQPPDSAYPIKPTNQSQKTTAWFEIQQGTGMDIYIDWDSNKPKTRTSVTAYDMDRNNKAMHFFGAGTHSYSTIDTYNVTVHATNAVSSLSVTEWAIYEVPISPFVGVMRQLDDKESYIEVNETICFDMKPPAGTNVLIKYDFNDTTSEPVVTPNTTVCKSWPNWQLPFYTKFLLYNNVSAINKEISVFVQWPVQNFSNVVIRGGPENTTEEMDLVITLDTGDYCNCTYTIHDTTVTTKFGLADKYQPEIIVKHQFATPGTYDVFVFCKNRLYEVSAKTNVTSYIKSTDFDVKVKYGGPCGAKKKEGDLGDGPDRDQYAFGCPLKFFISEQGGSNITYEFDFGEGQKESTELLEMTHTFEQGAVNSQKIKVKAFNPTSFTIKEFELKFMPRISGLKIGNDGPKKMGVPITYNVTVQEKGFDSCFLVDCEYGKDEKKQKTSQQFWMGETSCKFLTKYKPINAKPDLEPKSAKWQHTFQHTGIFKCTVTGENSVSEETASTEVTVLDKPCFLPKLQWDGISELQNEPTNITRSRRKTVGVKVTKDCEKTDKVTYHWNLTRIDPVTGKSEIVKAINHTESTSALKITPRSLVYGQYKINLKVCMKDVDPVVCETITGYLQVQPSKLVARFEGGSGRAGGWNKTLDILGTPSHDPDIGEGTVGQVGLNITWYCKQQSETFPANLSSLPDIDYPSKVANISLAQNTSFGLADWNFTGCFGNGIGRLKQFDDKTTLTVKSIYMPIGNFYTFRMVIEKPASIVPRTPQFSDYSLFVVLGDPPEIKIKCINNCQDKKNRDQDFKLQALCIANCRNIGFRWSLKKKKKGESDDKLVDVADKDFEAMLNTPIDNKNLAMKKNKIEETNEYVVRLTGTNKQFTTLYGFSLYSIVVNKQPTKPSSTSRVRVSPVAGEPLKKDFKVYIGGFEDEDVPLMYYVDYRVGNPKRKRRDATGTEPKWINMHSSLSPITDASMFPAGDKNDGDRIYLKIYVEDAYRGRSEPVEKVITVKAKSSGGADLTNVLKTNGGSTDPGAAGMVANAVLGSLGGSDDSGGGSGGGDVVSAVVDMMDNVEVNSPEGALALASTMSTCMGTGVMSPEAQEKAMKAMTKVAAQMDSDTPPQIVEAVADSALNVILKGAEGGGGNAQDGDETIQNLGKTVAGNMVDGEAPYQVKTGKSLIACQAMEPGGSGGVSLGSGGGFEMDSSQLGEAGVPMQAVGGNGPDKYSNKSSATVDVTSDVVSLDMSSGGKPMVVQNLSKPITVQIKQPINPYPPTQHTAYTHILKVVNVVSVPSDNQSSVFIDIIPTIEVEDASFYVIIKKGFKPKLNDSDFNFTLPHINSTTKPNGQNKTAKEMDIDFRNRYRIFLHGADDLNNTAIGTYYVAVLNTPRNVSNVTYPIMTTETQPGPLNITIPPRNYTFSSYTGICKFFNKTSKQWSTAGLKITQETTMNVTFCETTHLSSFGGGAVFAKPNTIDFSKAFAGFSNIGDNPTVFATTLSIIGLYFVLLAYCRYKDKKDIEKIGVFPLEDNHPSDNYLYEIAVQTGFVKGAGTTADVFLVLIGNLGETSPRKIDNPNRKCFNKGDTDSFLLSTPFSLGVIKEIEVWHNNGGNSPGWYCMQVQIKDVQTEKKWIFVCNRWLAVEEDDGEIKRKLEVATKNDLVQFDFLFAQTARKNLYDGHIWFSIFTRPPRSTFTRCQRLGCCLTLLLTSMLANAMFYKDPAPASTDPNAPKAAPSDSLHLGPITISLDQIRIGITSSLVVVPVNLIIATLFQKAKPREEKKPKKNKYEADDEDENEDVGTSRVEVSASKIDLVEKGENRPSVDMGEENEPEMDEEALEIEKSKKRANFLKMICMPGNEDDEEAGDSGKGKKKKAKPKAMLPHWVIYIAYILIFLASGTAAFFVILYGFQFGKEKSDNWMTSMMLSFWQSVLVIQPVKVLAISVLVALIIKDPKAGSADDEGGPKSLGKDEKAQEGKKKKKKKEGEEGEEGEEDESEEEEEEEEPDRGLDFKLPDEKKLEEARQLRLKEKKMKAIIREIVIHLLFVMLCLFIGYSNMDPFAVGFGKGVRDYNSGGLQQVTRVEEYYDWLEKTFIPYLYPGKWYNGDPYKKQFVADNEPSRIISMARMRQLRVKRNSCTKHPVFENLISECNPAYSWSDEETGQYSAGWKPPLNKTATRKLRHRKRKAYYLGLENPWQHQSVLKLKNFPFMGTFATYSGSSYAASIGPDARIAGLIVKNMKDNFWIDRYTRAVFVELNIYNANANLMMIVTFLSEVLQTGGWNYFDNVQAIRLYRWQGGLGGIIVFADLIFMVVTLIGLYKLVKACRKQGVKAYLKNTWQAMHAFVTVFSICTFACVFARVGAVMWAMKQYKNDPEVYVSFAYLGTLDYFVQAFIGFVVMATNLEFLRLLRFNKKIGLLTATIKQSMKPLLSFGLIFLFIFLSYVSLAHLLFVSQLEDYKNFGISVVSLTRMFLGQFDVPAYRAIAPLLGPMLFFTYMIAIQMVLINMFIGIICETFEEVRIDIEKQDNDHEIVSFMTHRFKKMAGAAVGPSVDPIYREWKTDWELMLDSIEEKSDSIIYLMRNVEAEEVRQTHWMEPTKANEKKKNMLKMLIGSDEFTYENEILDTLQLLDKRMKKIDTDKSKKMVYTMAKKKKKDREEEMKSHEEQESIFSESGEEEDIDENEEDENEDE